MSRPWTPEQLEAISEHRAEIVVSAAAGSGKTAVLIERVLRAALGVDGRDGVPLDRMLVATFTRAAAAELRTRLHAELLRELNRRRDSGMPIGTVRDQLAALPRAPQARNAVLVRHEPVQERAHGALEFLNALLESVDPRHADVHP